MREMQTAFRNCERSPPCDLHQEPHASTDQNQPHHCHLITAGLLVSGAGCSLRRRSTRFDPGPCSFSTGRHSPAGNSRGERWNPGGCSRGAGSWSTRRRPGEASGVSAGWRPQAKRKSFPDHPGRSAVRRTCRSPD